MSTLPALARPSTPSLPARGTGMLIGPRGVCAFQHAASRRFVAPTLQASASACFSHSRLAAQTVRAPQMSGFSHNRRLKLPAFPQEKWSILPAQGKFKFYGGYGPHAFFCPGNRSWGYRFSATTTGPNPPLAGLTTSWDGGPHPVFHPDNENTTDTELLLQP